MFALTVNASLLILAAAAFHHTGRTEIAEIGQAHTLCCSRCSAPRIAPTLFGIALLCCGLNSTVTATMAGQIVMEGFINFRLPPWLRRLVTRGIAIVPAAGVTIAYGESGTAQVAHPESGDLEPAAALRGHSAGDARLEKDGAAVTRGSNAGDRGARGAPGGLRNRASVARALSPPSVVDRSNVKRC